MGSSVSVQVDGQVSVSLTNGGQCGTADVPEYLLLKLRSFNSAFTSGTEIGQKLMTINSPGAWVTVPLPAGMRVRVLAFRAHEGTFTGLRLTHATAGALVHPTQGLYLAEWSEVEQVTVIEVRGEGSYEWVAAGTLP